MFAFQLNSANTSERESACIGDCLELHNRLSCMRHKALCFLVRVGKIKHPSRVNTKTADESWHSRLRLALLTIDQLHRLNASIIALFSALPSGVNVRTGSDKQTLSVSQQNRFVSRFRAKRADESDSKLFITRFYDSPSVFCDAKHRRPKFSCRQYATGSSSSPLAFCAAFPYLRILA